ncbi:MAG: glycosyltransferase family 39 protein [Deltaproteobacteria bacterium]|nr:glycosyltransferase family 39 protein [Deltaproteobacteria bacterium]
MSNSIGDVSNSPNPGIPSPTAVLLRKWMATLISPLFVLFLVPLVLYVAVLPVMPLMEPDEARYALIPQYMNQTGDYITPHLKGVAYLEKPPLAYWATALFFKAFGDNAFAARLFAGLCAWGCILLVYNMGFYFHDRKTGLYSAAVLSVSLLLFALGRINVLDMPLTLFLCLAIWCGFRFFQSHGTADKKWLYGFYGSSALAFLTKGVIGVVFPPAVIVLWLLWSRRWRDILRIFSPVGILLFALPVGAWLFMVQRANPDFFWFFFIHEHFLRYTTKIHERVEPFWYYLPVVLLGITPWWAYLTQALMGVRRAGWRLFGKEEIRLFAVWTGFIFLFFSLSSSKLASYIAPVILPLAVLVGRIFTSYEGQGGSGEGNKTTSWTLAPAVVQSLALGVLMLAPLFVREYREIGPPGGSWLWLGIPVIVAAAILFIPEILRKRAKTGWFASVYILFAIYLISLLFPLSHYLTPGKSALDVVRAIRAHVPADAVVYQYRSTMYGIDFYTGRNTPIVEDLGELKFGADRIDPQDRERRFPKEEEFVRAVKMVAGKAATVPAFAVTEGKGNVETLRRSFPAARIVWDNRKFYLLALPQFSE